MSKIHFIGGEKGGIGKSVLARLLAQYHIDHALPFQGFDTDRSHGALLRFYGDFARPLALEDFSSADRIMEAALEQEQDILVDLAAQTAQPLHQWIEQNDLPELAQEQHVGLFFWHVLDDGADGIRLLDNLLGRLGEDGNCLVVRNHGRGRDFSAYENSPVHARAEELGARTLELPELHPATMRRIDHGGASFWAAANLHETGLGIMERQRVRVWMKRFYQQLEPLAGELFVQAAQPDTATEVPHIA